MRIIRKITGMQQLSERLRSEGRSIGLVPTMGALHEGHLSLIRRAKKENDLVIVSIFVNPFQFVEEKRGDYYRYPRNLKKDAQLAKDAGADIIFAPFAKEIYPSSYATFVNVEAEIASLLEGKSRPGHFRGVATIVLKLFNIIMPHKSYFGKKDFQQLLVIKKMVEDLNLAIGIVACPLIRDKNGLALSSRNAYLSIQERKKALILNKALQKAKEKIRQSWQAKSCLSPGKIIREMQRMINLANGNSRDNKTRLKIDYIVIRDSRSLKPVKKIRKNIVIALAAKIGKTRLLDNILL